MDVPYEGIHFRIEQTSVTFCSGSWAFSFAIPLRTQPSKSWRCFLSVQCLIACCTIPLISISTTYPVTSTHCRFLGYIYKVTDNFTSSLCKCLIQTMLLLCTVFLELYTCIARTIDTFLLAFSIASGLTLMEKGPLGSKRDAKWGSYFNKAFGNGNGSTKVCTSGHNVSSIYTMHKVR